MNTRGKFMLVVLVLSFYPCCRSEQRWLQPGPILSARLHLWYTGLSLILAHLALWVSLYDLYGKALKQTAIQPADVRRTVGLLLITSAMCLGTIVQISFR